MMSSLASLLLCASASHSPYVNGNRVIRDVKIVVGLGCVGVDEKEKRFRFAPWEREIGKGGFCQCSLWLLLVLGIRCSNDDVDKR